MTNEIWPEQTHKGDHAHQAWNKADAQSMVQSLQTAKKLVLVPMKTIPFKSSSSLSFSN